MKILHVTPTYLPAVRYGGPVYSVHALCRALARAGHEVHALTTSVNGTGDSDVPHDRAVDLNGVQVHYCRSGELRRLFYSRALAAHLRAHAGDFDVLHLHTVYVFPTWAGARAATRANVPYLLSPRGMLVRDLIARRNAVIKRAWIGLIERRNLARAARIHLTSREELRALAELGLVLAPTAIVPNGVDPPAPLSPDRVSDDVAAAIRAGFDMLSFGRIHWKKGLDRLIRALPNVPNARLVIAGNDEDGYAEALGRMAAEQNVADRVRIIARFTSGDDKEALFAAARLFVLPSLSENFGNVVAEAMVRRVPVAVTEAVGAAEIVRASGSGVIAGKEEGALAQTLAEALASPARLAEMGAAGQTYAREALNWDGIARRFEELYGEVIRARANDLPSIA